MGLIQVHVLTSMGFLFRHFLMLQLFKLLILNLLLKMLRLKLMLLTLTLMWLWRKSGTSMGCLFRHLLLLQLVKLLMLNPVAQDVAAQVDVAYVDVDVPQGGINLLFARISDAASSSRRSQQYKQ